MTVTASVLYDLVQCPQRVALDAFGDNAKRDEINAFVQLLWDRGTLFERETHCQAESALHGPLRCAWASLSPHAQ
jgi:hypothetical protein